MSTDVFYYASVYHLPVPVNAVSSGLVLSHSLPICYRLRVFFLNNPFYVYIRGYGLKKYVFLSLVVFLLPFHL